MNNDLSDVRIEGMTFGPEETKVLNLFKIDTNLIVGLNLACEDSYMIEVAEVIEAEGTSAARELILNDFNNLVQSILMTSCISESIRKEDVNAYEQSMNQHQILMEKLENIGDIQTFINEKQDPRFLYKFSQYLAIQVKQFEKNHSSLARKISAMKRSNQITSRGDQQLESTLINLEKVTRLTESIISIISQD